jgi:hypothetical protein
MFAIGTDLIDADVIDQEDQDVATVGLGPGRVRLDGASSQGE